VSLLLADLVTEFAVGIKAVDALAPIASNSRTGASFQPGIGPHTEAQTIKLVMAHLADTDPQRYDTYRLGVPYLGAPGSWAWAVEVKMLRLMGDNGKLNDNMVMHILSPYPAHRSALTDCTKLLASQLGTHKAVLIYGYDYPDWPMDPAIEAFQVLASREVKLANPVAATFDGLIHPVHRRGRVFGWQLEPLDE
jgi:hypothetical protein